MTTAVLYQGGPLHNTPEEAARAYNKYVVERYGPLARLNEGV